MSCILAAEKHVCWKNNCTECICYIPVHSFPLCKFRGCVGRRTSDLWPAGHVVGIILEAHRPLGIALMVVWADLSELLLSSFILLSLSLFLSFSLSLSLSLSPFLPSSYASLTWLLSVVRHSSKIIVITHSSSLPLRCSSVSWRVISALLHPKDRQTRACAVPRRGPQLYDYVWTADPPPIFWAHCKGTHCGRLHKSSVPSSGNFPETTRMDLLITRMDVDHADRAHQRLFPICLRNRHCLLIPADATVRSSHLKLKENSSCRRKVKI